MRELFGCGISPAALRTVGQRCSYKLINTELRIKGELKRAGVIGADETGVRVGGKNHWVHVTRTDQLTHYGYDARRGKAATMELLSHIIFMCAVSHDMVYSSADYSLYGCRRKIRLQTLNRAKS
jgi:transposase